MHSHNDAHIFYFSLIHLRNVNNLSSWQSKSPEGEGSETERFLELSFQSPLLTPPASRPLFAEVEEQSES